MVVPTIEDPLVVYIQYILCENFRTLVRADAKTERVFVRIRIPGAPKLGCAMGLQPTDGTPQGQPHSTVNIAVAALEEAAANLPPPVQHRQQCNPVQRKAKLNFNQPMRATERLRGRLSDLQTIGTLCKTCRHPQLWHLLAADTLASAPLSPHGFDDVVIPFNRR